MVEFTNIFLHFVFIAVFAILIVVSVIILKPFRIHRKRPISTISLKVSYLLFLISFIVLTFMILFYADIPEGKEGVRDNFKLTVFYIIIMMSFFIPNIGIMFRRKVKKLRIYYNIVFTAVNVVFFIAIVLMYFYFPLTIN